MISFGAGDLLSGIEIPKALAKTEWSSKFKGISLSGFLKVKKPGREKANFKSG